MARTLEGRISKGLIDHLRVEHGDRSIDIHADGFCTLADLATLVEDGAQGEATSGKQPQAPTGPKR